MKALSGLLQIEYRPVICRHEEWLLVQVSMIFFKNCIVTTYLAI